MSISGVNELSANRIFTIAELYDEINKVLSSSIVLSGVRVKGEVSSYKYYQSSGHIYMTLVQKANKKDNYGKDVFYRIDAKWWKGKNQYSKDKDKIKVGDVITVIGSINCYNVQSNVSIIIDSVHLTDEEGRSKAEREKLRLELEKKGYFDDAHKKPFPPKYPRAIGIITSQSGDARHDIEKTVQKKNPYVQLYLLHALVQGAGAGKSIANAIRFFDKKEDVDIIIIGRGGGDKLDLAAFDDAEVVEAIYNCNTYIIAGTGHTPDRTLADFAVDKLANNPTDAAYEAVFDVVSELEKIDNQIKELNYNIYRTYDLYDRMLEEYLLKIESRSPAKQLGDRFAELDKYFQGMSYNMLRVLGTYENGLASYMSGLQVNNPRVKVEKIESELAHISDNISRNMRDTFVNRWNAFAKECEMLEAQNPAKKLIGGFGYIEKDGSPVASIKDVKVDDDVKVKLSDGFFMAQVTKIEED